MHMLIELVPVENIENTSNELGDGKNEASDF